MKRQIVNDELAKEIELHVNEVKTQVPVSDNMWVVFADEGISKSLNVIDGVIFKSDRIYVPDTMQKDMIENAHDGHLGREDQTKG